jgi:hypothetical protein
LALAQLPNSDLHPEILVRTDVGGATHRFTADCREAGIRFSVGRPADQAVRDAILNVPQTRWIQAVVGDSEDRDGPWVTEITSLTDLTPWPQDSRLIVRRERAHHGAQFTSLTATATGTHASNRPERSEHRDAGSTAPAARAHTTPSPTTKPGLSYRGSPKTSSAGPGCCACTGE